MNSKNLHSLKSEEVTSYNILESTAITSLIGTIILRKRLMEGKNPSLALKTTINQFTFSCGKKKKLLFEILIPLVILYGCEVWICNVS